MKTVVDITILFTSGQPRRFLNVFDELQPLTSELRSASGN